MSSIDRIKEWEKTLPPQLRERIDNFVDQIKQRMDIIVRNEGVIDKIIQDFINLCDEIGLPREQTSTYIKHKLKGLVSDDMIERRLPQDRKRKHERYHEETSATVRKIADLPEKEITVSHDGSEEPEPDEPLPTNEEVLATAANMAVEAEKYKDEQLQKANETIKKQENEIQKLQRIGVELELNISELQTKLKAKPQISEKQVDQLEELQIKYDEIVQAYRELKEVMRIQTAKQDFKPASQVENPKTVWIAALNCFGLSRSLMQLSMKLSDDSARGKVLFDIAADGSIKNPRLATPQTTSE